MNRSLPSEDLKIRLLRAVEATPAPTRAAESKRAAWLLAGALFGSLLVYFTLGGVRLIGRPPSLIVGTVAGTATIAAVAMWIAIARGRAMAGRTSSWLTAVAIAAPLALIAWKIFWSAQYEHGLDRMEGRLGLRCLGVSLTLAVLPLAALLFSRRGTDAVHPARAGMGVGVAVGLVVATLVDTWCPVAYVPHFLLGHVVPLAVLGAAGLWFGRKILAP
ncbi:MAG TPA: NrsF family protein [Polyangiaceae bacterium]|nr:NrsF family protein [Polyangiaceae bacterium]